MQLVVLVLNKTECLEELLEKFVEINVKGATIIESSGMAKALYNDSHVSDLFGSLRALINPRKESKTAAAAAAPGTDKYAASKNARGDISSGIFPRGAHYCFVL